MTRPVVSTAVRGLARSTPFSEVAIMALRDFKKVPTIKASGMDERKLHEAIKALASRQLLVGIPQSAATRDDGEPITNATIGYISEFGSPAANIPARPWLFPGIRMNQEKLVGGMFQTAKLAFSGRASGMQIEKALNVVGIEAVSGIRKRIADGLDPPLANYTLYKRATRGDEGSAWELSWRQAGTDAANGQLAKPLIDTGNFIKSISYVVVNRKAGA